MPTPLFYENVAVKLKRYIPYFTTCFVMGIILCLLSAVFIKTVPNGFLIFGIGILLIIWGWGLFLVCKWFNPSASIFKIDQDNLQSDNKMLTVLKAGGRWSASIFLTIWFLSTIGILFFILSRLR